MGTRFCLGNAALLAGLFSLLALTLPACGSDSGSGSGSLGGLKGGGTGGSGATSNGSCPAASGDSACDTCLKAHCCQQINACSADQSCASCAPNDTCGQSNSTFNALVNCGNDSCSTECSSM